MRILVAVKRVPITGGKMVLTEDEQALETKHLGFTISPHEECAVEEAVRIVDAKGRRSYVTSAGMGPSLGKYLLMTYLPPGDHGQLFVQYMEELYPVTVEVVGSRPPFDPDNERIRS